MEDEDLESMLVEIGFAFETLVSLMKYLADIKESPTMTLIDAANIAEIALEKLNLTYEKYKELSDICEGRSTTTI